MPPCFSLSLLCAEVFLDIHTLVIAPHKLCTLMNLLKQYFGRFISLGQTPYLELGFQQVTLLEIQAQLEMDSRLYSV